MPRFFPRLFCLTFAVAWMPAVFAADSTEAIGPKQPKVLWLHKSTEHFVAAPAVGEKGLYVTAVGAFNTGLVYAMSLDTNASEKERIAWSESSPFLKLPTVSTPAVADGKIVFGDAMHQND